MLKCIYNIEFENLVNTSWNFVYSGGYQQFKVPISGNYKIELWGASGSNHQTLAGRGGYTSGIVHLDANEKLYIYVGQSLNTTAATYNGGGSCSSGCTSGGGATDVRYFEDYEPTDSDLVWNSEIGLNSRIMVAAGGGGYNSYSSGYKGGIAGGLTGGNSAGNEPSKGASQLSGGAGTKNLYNGSFGTGGSTSSTWGGGGGAGYYGGGAGADSATGNGGAGGSSYISGYLGSVAITSSSDRTPRKDKNNTVCTEALALNDITCSYHYSGKIFSETVMKSGSEEMTSPTGSSETGHLGNGYARITFVN